MPSKKDAAAELAEEMIGVLETQRRLGPDFYPLTVGRLVELTDRRASPAQFQQALGKRAFQSRVVVARANNRQSPVALAGDAELLAGSRLVIEFLLEALRTPSNQAFSLAQLKARTARKLQKALQAAIAHQIEEGSLPPTVGWITVSRTRKLFLLADLHVGRQESRDRPLPPGTPPFPRADGPSAGARAPLAEPADSFVEAFDRAFDRLDRQAGAHNFVSLADLRAALPMAREAFDSGLQKLRLAGRYGLSSAEGRHGITPEERAAAIMEGGTLLLYLSRKSP